MGAQDVLGLTFCPALSGRLEKQLFNDHRSVPPRKVSFIRSANSQVCKPSWGPLMKCPWLLGHHQIMLQKLFFRLRKCPEYRVQPFIFGIFMRGIFSPLLLLVFYLQCFCHLLSCGCKCAAENPGVCWWVQLASNAGNSQILPAAIGAENRANVFAVVSFCSVLAWILIWRRGHKKRELCLFISQEINGTKDYVIALGQADRKKKSPNQ